jgi:hypothetical protein
MSARGPWLFSQRLDAFAFLGSAAISVGLLGLGALLGILDGDTPAWAWVLAVLLCDVAHVYGSFVRVYFDPHELARRPVLYLATPIFAYVGAACLYAQGDALFWRTLAYLAVFHFVRQQAGWVALYRAKAGERDGRFTDLACIYLATLYPLFYWHVHASDHLYWMMPGDFFAWSGFAMLLPAVEVLWAIALCAYCVRAARAWQSGRPNPGKDMVVATTAFCWWIGIVYFQSDYAFTVTNVFIHGIPYLVLIYVMGRATGRPRRVFAKTGAARLIFVVWLCAFVEEFLWDHAAWHDHEWLFGGGFALDSLRPYLVPLLAVPQITHYVLDGFIWRRSENPDVALALGGAR